MFVDTNAIDRMEAVVSNPHETLVVADYDGTLAPFETDPMTVRLFSPTVEAAMRVAARFAWTAVLTGREDGYAGRQIPWSSIVATNYGACVRTGPVGDVLWRDEQFFARAERVETLIDLYRDRIERSGLIVQRQGPPVMLHWEALSGSVRAEA